MVRLEPKGFGEKMAPDSNIEILFTLKSLVVVLNNLGSITINCPGGLVFLKGNMNQIKYKKVLQQH